MAKAFIDDINLSNIADAIRRLTETTDTYLPSEMAAAINNITIQKYYTGNSTPSDDLGNDGDLYFVTGG